MTILGELIGVLAADAPARDVRVGRIWTAVWSRERGLASTGGPGEHARTASFVQDVRSLSGQSALQPATLAHSESFLEAGIGLAPSSTLLEVDEVRRAEINAGDHQLERGRRGKVALLGGVAAVILALGGAPSGIPRPAAETLQDTAAAAQLCARCHEGRARLAAETGGHGKLECEDCHRNRRQGRFGRRHRTVVSCAKHHAEKGHPKRRAKRSARSKRKLIRNCTTCHEPHGSTNLSLVRQTVRVRRRLRRVRFDSGNGAGPGGFTDPAAVGSGLCEVCHRRTDFYRRKGGGAPHFTEPCTTCHQHEASFSVVASEESCAICHEDKSARFAKASLHSARFRCGGCHAEASSEPGAGHRRVPDCVGCHAGATHGPPGAEPLACTRCHDPHGSNNIKLVREQITTPRGETRPIRFDDNLGGRADGSFASVSEPGSGICEICHTATAVYRTDGGASHVDSSCVTCHSHQAGFRVADVSGDSCAICHPNQDARFAKAGSHSANYSCSDCHAEDSDHRRVPDCGECHSGATHATHTAPGVGPFACTRCHDPHGSNNIKLVREQITTPQGETRPIRFDDNLGGRADGSFASVSEPGSGICEICHTATAVYREDGNGSLHADFSCLTCHVHSAGFGGVHPQPGDESFPCALCHQPHDPVL